MKKPNCFRVFVSLALLAVARTPAAADEFYTGETIRFIVGFSAGGGYDTYTRAIARHIGKHIPGNPQTVVENMVGAGSLLAANHLFAKAEPDGLHVGVWNAGMIMQQALGAKAVRFDAQKFGFIGAPGKGIPTRAIMAFTGLRTLDDVINSTKIIRMGGARTGTGPDDIPKLMNKLMGTQFQVISGYEGTAPIRLAMQRSEVDGACWTWDSMRVTARTMLDATGEDELIPFIVHGKAEDPEVKDLPQFTKAIKGEENLSAFRAYLLQYEFQRPFTLPPNTPKDRLELLRKAFRETLHDEYFLAEAKKSKLTVDYVSGEESEKYVKEILSTPAGAKEKLRFLLMASKKN